MYSTLSHAAYHVWPNHFKDTGVSQLYRQMHSVTCEIRIIHEDWGIPAVPFT